MTMRRIGTLGLVGLLASTAFTVAVGAEGDGLGNWRNAVSTNDFNLALTHYDHPVGMASSVEKRHPPPFPHPIGMRPSSGK